MASYLWFRIASALLLGLAGWQGGIGIPNAGSFLPWGLVGLAAGLVVGLVAFPPTAIFFLRRVTHKLESYPTQVIVMGTVGLLLGLMVAALLSIPLFRLPDPASVIAPIVLSVVLGALGVAAMVGRDVGLAHGMLQPGAETYRGNGGRRSEVDGRMLLDTSAIIDGRIADISHAGFLRGTLVIPRFILDELRHIADSSDALRRNRGRRGLDMLNKLRKDSQVPIQVVDADVGGDSIEVDGKLVIMAKAMGAAIITTDFNLNKVAELQGVQVLNINELANALKPVVLPGEEMTLRVIQEGKESGQGVGFLDDGTMVVVEGGRRYINAYLDVVITRVLQTAAGRIIFALPKGS